MHNQERNKNTKLSPLRYSTFIRARRVKHPYNVRTLLLLRSGKIQSKPVSQTWHKSAGHFQLMISLFKLKFHVVQASFFFFNLRDWLCYGVAWLDFGTTAKLSEVMWCVDTILRRMSSLVVIKLHITFVTVDQRTAELWMINAGQEEKKNQSRKKRHKTRSKENKTNSMLSVYVQVVHDYWSLTVKWKSVKRLLDNIEN